MNFAELKAEIIKKNPVEVTPAIIGIIEKCEEIHMQQMLIKEKKWFKEFISKKDVKDAIDKFRQLLLQKIHESLLVNFVKKKDHAKVNKIIDEALDDFKQELFGTKEVGE